MTLSEFIKKRLEEMGKNRSWLVNSNDLEWTTLSNIDHGKTISKVTQEKLAKALECSQGDIQACLAEQNPLKKVPIKSQTVVKPETEPVMVEAKELDQVVVRYKAELKDRIFRDIIMKAEPGETVESLWIRVGKMMAEAVL